jgi:hypothetical protein
MISELGVGDPVYSLHRGGVAVVPIIRTNRTAVDGDHRVIRVELESGRVLEISAGHPTADGRTFGSLRAGDELDGVEIVGVEHIPYAHSHTYDILPDSDTGTYYAGGALIGSTLTR